jgi:DNA-binding transcriptional LysR family regulator
MASWAPITTLINRFVNTWPDVQIQFVHELTMSLLDQVRSRYLDAAFVLMAHDDADFTSLVLSRESLVVALPRGTPPHPFT